MTTITDKWAAQESQQGAVNAFAFLTGLDRPADLRLSIIEIADRAHRQYPQYAGYWTGPEWVLAKITRRLRSKGGIQFKKGDLAIVARRPDEDYDLAYSVRLGWNCSISPANWKEATQ